MVIATAVNPLDRPCTAPSVAAGAPAAPQATTTPAHPSPAPGPAPMSYPAGVAPSISFRRSFPPRTPPAAAASPAARCSPARSSRRSRHRAARRPGRSPRSRRRPRTRPVELRVVGRLLGRRSVGPGSRCAGAVSRRPNPRGPRVGRRRRSRPGRGQPTAEPAFALDRAPTDATEPSPARTGGRRHLRTGTDGTGAPDPHPVTSAEPGSAHRIRRASAQPPDDARRTSARPARPHHGRRRCRGRTRSRPCASRIRLRAGRRPPAPDEPRRAARPAIRLIGRRARPARSAHARSRNHDPRSRRPPERALEPGLTVVGTPIEPAHAGGADVRRPGAQRSGTAARSRPKPDPDGPPRTRPAHRARRHRTAGRAARHRSGAGRVCRVRHHPVASGADPPICRTSGQPSSSSAGSSTATGADPEGSAARLSRLRPVVVAGRRGVLGPAPALRRAFRSPDRLLPTGRAEPAPASRCPARARSAARAVARRRPTPDSPWLGAP